jgi:hypothetical protein
MNLTDAGGCRRLVVELAEPTCPTTTELLRQHAMHDIGAHGRCRLLQARQCFSVGRSVVLGHRRFKDRQRLAELHRAAFELAEHSEQLLGGLLLQFGRDRLGRVSDQSFTQSHRGSACNTQR